MVDLGDLVDSVDLGDLVDSVDLGDLVDLVDSVDSFDLVDSVDSVYFGILLDWYRWVSMLQRKTVIFRSGGSTSRHFRGQLC